MMNIIQQKMIFRSDLRNNPNCYYVFGDNDQRVGLGGQAAEMRSEPNAVGIRTLKAPGVPYTDVGTFENTKKITEDFSYVYRYYKLGFTIILPTDGVGTDLAMMKENAPYTFRFLKSTWKNLLVGKECIGVYPDIGYTVMEVK
jgi:hypothetical protein